MPTPRQSSGQIILPSAPLTASALLQAARELTTKTACGRKPFLRPREKGLRPPEMGLRPFKAVGAWLSNVDEALQEEITPTFGVELSVVFLRRDYEACERTPSRMSEENGSVKF